MNKHGYTPLYQHEDKAITVRIGKPDVADGIFLAIDGNVQFRFNQR